MGCDRISQLPDPLITQILLFLPTKDSIKTSVLCKRWRTLWLNVPGLDIHSNDFPSLYKAPIKNFIESFLEFNRESRLQKFKIEDDQYNCNICNDSLNEWIETALNRGVQYLDVEIKNVEYAIDYMPMDIYKSKTLVSLKLVRVGLNNPEFVVSLPCLRNMHLEDICNDADGCLIMEKLILGCPVLENLTLVRNHFDNLETRPLLRVRSQTLKTLSFTVLTFEPRTGSLDYLVEIDAPGLKYMSFRDTQSDRIMVKNLTSLVKIDLDIDFNVKRGALDLTKRDIICDFLIEISSVRRMVISQPTLEILYRYSKLGLIPELHNLCHLQAAFSSSSLQLLPAFLESCPNLKNIVLDFPFSTKPKRIDLTVVPRCLLSTLECVEVKELIMEETGIKLLNYFLENSAVLKKLCVSFIDSPLSDQELNIYKKLLTSTRRSPRCQVLLY